MRWIPLSLLTALLLLLAWPDSLALAQEPPPLPNRIFLPFLAAAPQPSGPVETILVCSNPEQEIPDNVDQGIRDQMRIEESRRIVDLNVSLDVPHPWIGDLSVTLEHEDTGRRLALIHTPGYPDLEQGCSRAGIGAILDDEISLEAENQCSDTPRAIAGIFRPLEALSAFDGESLAGAWNLHVADLSRNSTGSLRRWCLAAQVSSIYTPPPLPPPLPDLPRKAYIEGFQGKNQALPLDCESRVAVDWARFFGVHIGEMEFFEQLPLTDNPDTGFVGDVNDSWGQIPPQSYGVHAAPVAALLRTYGLPAYAHRPLTLDALKAEIAAGRPVIVWVIGSASRNSEPLYYRPSDGSLTVVAAHEHTVTVIGYTQDTITIQDGSTESTRSLDTFLASWSALGNMALTTSP